MITSTYGIPMATSQTAPVDQNFGNGRTYLHDRDDSIAINGVRLPGKSMLLQGVARPY